jgi:hypothetical protein
MTLQEAIQAVIVAEGKLQDALLDVEKLVDEDSEIFETIRMMRAHVSGTIFPGIREL